MSKFFDDTMQGLLEAVEDVYLLKILEQRNNNDTIDFEKFVAEQGYSMDELEEMAESVDHRPVANLISIRISQISKNLITDLLSIGSIDPFKVLYICHHHMKILIRIKAHQRLCMMEKGLSDIKPCKIIIFQS